MRTPVWLGTEQQIRFAAIQMKTPVVDKQQVLDQCWVTRQNLIYTVSMPPQPPTTADGKAVTAPVVRAIAFLKVWDGEWYQLESKDIQPSPRGLDITFSFDADWQPQDCERPWSRDNLRRVRATGLRLYGAEVAEREMTVLDVRADGDIITPSLVITLGDIPATEQRQMCEIPFTLSQQYDNPFATRKIAVDGVFTAVDGTVTRIPDARKVSCDRSAVRV